MGQAGREGGREGGSEDVGVRAEETTVMGREGKRRLRRLKEDGNRRLGR